MVQRMAHEELLLELSEESYHQWRHSPITSAYLKYLGDQIEAFRTAAMDLLEAGALKDQDMIRGRLATLRELQNLSLDDIKNFYRAADTRENDGTATDQRHTS